jgi:AraC-like DNA-binding protein
MISAVVLGSLFVLLLFSIQLLTNSEGNKLLNRLLAVSFIISSIPCVTVSLYLLNATDYKLVGIFVSGILMFLAPPVSYLYVRCFLYDETKLKRSDLMHFVPILFVFVNILPSLTDSAGLVSEINNSLLLGINDRTKFLFIPFSLHGLVRAVYSVVYVIFTWRLYIMYLNDKSRRLPKIHKIWIAYFLAIRTIFYFLFLIHYRNIYKSINIMKEYNANMYIISILFLCLVSYIVFIFKNPFLLYGNFIFNGGNRTIIQRDAGLPAPEEIVVLTNEQQIVYDPDIDTELQESKSLILHEDLVKKYITLLDSLMNEQKLFLNSSVGIDELSKKLDMPKYHIQYILKYELNKTLPEYINSFRINYFIANYPSDSSKYTIETMAKSSGFNSRSAFNSAFKKQTGKSILQYFDQNSVES